MIRLMLILVGTLALVMAGLLGFRGSKFDRPPIELIPHMTDQDKYSAQGAGAFFADGRAQRMPPEHAIPWGRDARRADATFATADEELFALERLPGGMSRSRLVLGREKFETYCAVCHGLSGKGDGIAAKYGLVPPPSYHADRLRQLSDGGIYQVITQGKGKMGSYADKLDRDERWAVIAYLRALQRAFNASVTDVPSESRKDLDK